jgi:hypothetical protein
MLIATYHVNPRNILLPLSGKARKVTYFASFPAKKTNLFYALTL